MMISVDCQSIRQSLDAGNALPKPDGIPINGRGGGAVFTGENGTSQIEILFSMNGRF